MDYDSEIATSFMDTSFFHEDEADGEEEAGPVSSTVDTETILLFKAHGLTGSRARPPEQFEVRQCIFCDVCYDAEKNVKSLEKQVLEYHERLIKGDVTIERANISAVAKYNREVDILLKRTNGRLKETTQETTPRRQITVRDIEYHNSKCVHKKRIIRGQTIRMLETLRDAKFAEAFRTTEKGETITASRTTNDFLRVVAMLERVIDKHESSGKDPELETTGQRHHAVINQISGRELKTVNDVMYTKPRA